MIQLLVHASLFAVMFVLGLGLHSAVLQPSHRRPALYIRAVIGSCLLVPLLALALLMLSAGLELGEPVRFGIALMALSPSAPLILQKARKKGGNRELAAMLQVLAALVAIVSIPLMADLFRKQFAVEGWESNSADVALQVLLAQVLPLLTGLGLGRWFPILAKKYLQPLDKLTNGLLLALVLVILVFALPSLGPFLAHNFLGLSLMALLAALSLLIGWLLAGPDQAERTTVALVTSMRNPGLALLFASIHAPGTPELKLAILSYSLVNELVSIPLLSAQRSRLAKH